LAITDGLLAVMTPIVTPASYVAWLSGKAGDRGNGIVL
jgi:hypothetical protein